MYESFGKAIIMEDGRKGYRLKYNPPDVPFSKGDKAVYDPSKETIEIIWVGNIYAKIRFTDLLETKVFVHQLSKVAG